MLSACKVYSKNFWAQFNNLCVQKRSGLLLSSDAFWKFSPCQFDKKVLGAFFSICASKNEDVCRKVQTQFGSSLPERFTEKSSGRNFTIFVSKNEAVCCEVQTHFGRFRLACFI